MAKSRTRVTIKHIVKDVSVTKRNWPKSQHPSPLAPTEIDAESTLMQALAEVAAEEEEDERPDNGEIEILSEDEYVE